MQKHLEDVPLVDAVRVLGAVVLEVGARHAEELVVAPLQQRRRELGGHLVHVHARPQRGGLWRRRRGRRQRRQRAIDAPPARVARAVALAAAPAAAALVEAELRGAVLAEVAVEAVVAARALGGGLRRRVGVAPPRRAAAAAPDRRPVVPLRRVAPVELPRPHVRLDADRLALQQRPLRVRAARAAQAVAVALVARAGAARPQIPPVGGVAAPALALLAARAAPAARALAHAALLVARPLAAAARAAPA